MHPITTVWHYAQRLPKLLEKIFKECIKPEKGSYVNWKVLLLWVWFYLKFLCFIYKSYDSVEWVTQSEFFSDLGKNNLGGKSLFWNYCLLFHMFQWTQEIYDVLLITFCSYLSFCPLKDERILSLFPSRSDWPFNHSRYWDWV